MTGSDIKLSVIIVSWNTKLLVDLCIHSVVQNLAERMKVEIILIDNDSSDGTAELIEDKYPDVVLIRNSENRGFVEAVNQGAVVSQGTYIMLLNSDAELCDSGVENILEVMDDESTIGISTGRMVDSKHRETPAYYRFPSIANLVKSYSVDRIFMMGHSLRGRVRNCGKTKSGINICDVDWVSGGYLIMRNGLQQDGELLDNRIFMYYEDLLLCRRAWKSGYRVVYVDTATVKHAKGASAKQDRISSVRYSYEGSRIYVQTVYGERVLRKYELLNRTIWKLLVSMFRFMGLLGMKSIARPKQELFANLLHSPRIT